MNKETVHFLNNIDFESTDEVYEKISSLFEENQRLKKQLEEHIKAEMKMEYEIQKLEEQGYTVIPNSDIKSTKRIYRVFRR